MPQHVTARVAVAVAVCAALFSSAVHSQAPSTRAPSAQDAPTFRSSVEAVSFEVFVTDAAGTPVTGLTVDDFELLEKGTPQPITTFSEIVIPIEPGAGKAAAWGIPPDIGTNDLPSGRTYIFALDESIVEFGILRTRQYLRQFLERFFNDNDVGAVVNVGRALATDGQTFTSNRQLLLKAIDKFSGGFQPRPKPPTGPPYYPLGTDLGRNTVDPDTKHRLYGLRTLVESLATIPGRKTVLYLTSSIGFDMFHTVDYHDGVLMQTAEAAHAVISAATRANVIFYPIDPAGLGLGGSLEEKMDFTALATVTGGFALKDSNSFMQTFERIQRESSAYYMLGFNSAYAKRDGRMVPVDVHVKRPGVKVTSREGYLAPLGETRTTEKEGDRSAALDAMASVVLTRGVSMRVFAAPFRTARREAAIALAVDINPETLGLTEQDGRRTGSVEVTYSAVDTRKRAYPGGRHTFNVSLTEADYAEARAHGLRMVSTLALPKGVFELRVGAASGARTGSVVHHFEVPDFAQGRLAMSGLALTTSRLAPATTLKPPPNIKAPGASVKCEPPSCIVPLSRETPSGDEPLRALASPAVARRVFDRAEELVVFAEVYENGRQAAHRLTFAVTLEGEDHTLRSMASETRASGGDQRNPTTQAFTVRASLRDVPVGRYLLRAQAQSDGDKDATAARAVPIEIR